MASTSDRELRAWPQRQTSGSPGFGTLRGRSSLASDYPYWDFDNPLTVLSFLPPAMKRRIEGLRNPKIPFEDHAAAAAHGWQLAQQIVRQGEYDLCCSTSRCGPSKQNWFRWTRSSP